MDKKAPLTCAVRNSHNGWGLLAVVRGLYVLVGVISGQKTWPLYGVEGWPRNRGFVSTDFYSDTIGTKVSGRYRRSGRLSGVVVKRGSTVVAQLKKKQFSKSLWIRWQSMNKGKNGAKKECSHTKSEKNDIG